MDGKVHHFGVVGYANGLAVMADEETRTLWDHISGEAFEGPLKGRVLDIWPMFITTIEAELTRHPATLVHVSSHRSLGKWLMRFLSRFEAIQGRGFIPPPFYLSMSKPIDPRLPKLTQGLGVIVGGKAKYYPINAIPKGGHIDDEWGNGILRVARSQMDGIPSASWHDTGEMPMQLLTRWYGFAFTYPDCEIYG